MTSIVLLCPEQDVALANAFIAGLGGGDSNFSIALQDAQSNQWRGGHSSSALTFLPDLVAEFPSVVISEREDAAGYSHWLEVITERNLSII